MKGGRRCRGACRELTRGGGFENGRYENQVVGEGLSGITC